MKEDHYILGAGGPLGQCSRKLISSPGYNEILDRYNGIVDRYHGLGSRYNKFVGRYSVTQAFKTK